VFDSSGASAAVGVHWIDFVGVLDFLVDRTGVALLPGVAAGRALAGCTKIDAGSVQWMPGGAHSAPGSEDSIVERRRLFGLSSHAAANFPSCSDLGSELLVAGGELGLAGSNCSARTGCGQIADGVPRVRCGGCYRVGRDPVEQPAPDREILKSIRAGADYAQSL
jgi:hypothetical protein